MNEGPLVDRELKPSPGQNSKILLTFKNILAVGLYFYLIAILIFWAIIWLTVDKWWLGTILLYGPRWIYAGPLILFIPALFNKEDIKETGFLCKKKFKRCQA